MKTIHELLTPALCVDARVLEKNLAVMATALPGPRLRPHVKAHKCTELAKRQAAHGHRTFTCATVPEAVALAASGLGEDILLANEIVDRYKLYRLAELVRLQPSTRITLAVDSRETVEAAARAGLRDVLIDVNVGLPRCGVAPHKAGKLADYARRANLNVRGVMGYEGHVVGMENRIVRSVGCSISMALLRYAHGAVGGDIVSAGGTGTYGCNAVATEIQAGSYALMDGTYAKLGLPFGQALTVLATVISISAGYVTVDAGVKCFGMDHGKPAGTSGLKVAYCADEHIVLFGRKLPRVGDRVALRPAHVDPTVACHERLHVIDGEQVLESWPVDMRGW